ncbi:hypothetical protein [Actinokineospora sp. UTMC 2448]|uniref:hypothetical protein n=1 Tax=Actinokineospora sp. UTMC 2448 TaxID=2268449 RepID=UPI0021643F88|nr:hypothetical protein [Actinokineospora sp. UTMC 2448]UVS80576.1 hypothetical protein Actkin_04327 [Actinokineospora sp. UTMC 2448]
MNTLVTAALITALAGCADHPAATIQPDHRRAEGSVQLGDLNNPKTAAEVGAPFDPCALTWADFPAAVRPVDGKPHSPIAQTLLPNSPFSVNCLYDNSTDQRSVFAVSVVWSRSKLDADPGKHRGSTARSWNNRRGLIKPFTDRKHGKACLGLVTLSTGVAGASVRNSRFRDTHPCTVVDALLNAITAKTS